MKTLIITFLFILVSCGQRTGLKFDEGTLLSPSTGTEAATFKDIKTQIIDPHCLSCHKKLTDEASIQKWIKPGKPEESVFFKVVEDGRMPKGKPALSTLELEMIRSYIRALAAPAEPIVKFDQIKSEILEAHACLNCHKAMTSEDKLLRWIDTSNAEKSKFYLRVVDGTMPKGGTPLEKKQQDLILKYIKNVIKGLNQ